jgi:hypothetical protein
MSDLLTRNAPLFLAPLVMPLILTVVFHEPACAWPALQVRPAPRRTRQHPAILRQLLALDALYGQGRRRSKGAAEGIDGAFDL